MASTPTVLAVKHPNICATMTLKKNQSTHPIGSMYGIFTYIWLICMVNVGKHTIPGSFGHASTGPHRLYLVNAPLPRWLWDAASAAEASELDATQQAQGAATNGHPTRGYVVANNTSSSHTSWGSVFWVCFWGLTTFSPGVWKPRVPIFVGKKIRSRSLSLWVEVWGRPWEVKNPK